ncbi:response regulator [Alcaligenaceae bacterium A4P071]|nr:response regulator [Alcaligenaceae bacterium A4P071]
MALALTTPRSSSSPRPLMPCPLSVLVVDDEPMLAELTSEILADFGFNAITRTCPLAALDWLALRHGLDLLITDVQMPRMDGLELARRAHIAKPDLPVIYVSGYSAQLAGTSLALPRQTLYVGKPFTRRDLLTAVAALCCPNTPIDGA